MTEASRAMSPRPLDTIGGAMGGERGNTGREAIRGAMTMGNPGKQAREAEREVERETRRRAARHTARWAKRRNDATHSGTKSGTGTDQASRDKPHEIWNECAGGGRRDMNVPA